MTIHPETLSGTASSGTFNVSTVAHLKGILRQVLASPATSTTQYDIKIVNNASLTIYERTSETGGLAEEVPLTRFVSYTVTISNSTVDELFTIHLVVEE